MSSVTSLVDDMEFELDLRRAKRAGILDLIVDVIRIEGGEMEGAWLVDHGRLWVFGPGTIMGD